MRLLALVPCANARSLRNPCVSQMAMPQPVKGADGRTYLPFFSNKYCFSNYFPSDFKVDGVMYSSVEQYYQHQKALVFKDASTAAYIMLSSRPKEATYLGRRVNGFDNIAWEDMCMEVSALEESVDVGKLFMTLR